MIDERPLHAVLRRVVSEVRLRFASLYRIQMTDTPLWLVKLIVCAYNREESCCPKSAWSRMKYNYLGLVMVMLHLDDSLVVANSTVTS